MLPALEGAKFTETLIESFGARVTFDPPLALKPPPDADAEEIVTFEFPTLVKLTSCPVEAPTVTLPKVQAGDAGRQLVGVFAAELPFPPGDGRRTREISAPAAAGESDNTRENENDQKGAKTWRALPRVIFRVKKNIPVEIYTPRATNEFLNEDLVDNHWTEGQTRDSNGTCPQGQFVLALGGQVRLELYRCCFLLRFAKRTGLSDSPSHFRLWKHNHDVG